MKIGILTFHSAINFGAVFQAYCLQETLKSLGHDTYIIDYRPHYLMAPYKPFYYLPSQYRSTSEKIKGLVRAIIVYPIRLKRRIEFQKFTKQYLNISHISFGKRENNFDALIFGSDQIWNPRITNNSIDPIFTGNFNAANGKIKISYAASSGDIKYLTPIHIQELVQQLIKFKSIGTREKDLHHLLKDNNVQNELVIDPVLLIEKATLLRIKKEYQISKRYLLLFQICRDEKAIEIAKKIAMEKNYIIIDVFTMTESLRKSSNNNYIAVNHINPGELISLFEKASYIVTTSFHGVALSILFEKEFISIPVNETTDTRVLNLLNTLNLKSRYIIHFDDIPNTDIDYNTTNAIKEHIVKRSLDFLKEI